MVMKYIDSKLCSYFYTKILFLISDITTIFELYLWDGSKMYKFVKIISECYIIVLWDINNRYKN